MYLLESPGRGDSNKYIKLIIYKKKCSKVSGTDAFNGSYQVSLQQQIRFYSKIFGNKHRRYNEGPLYHIIPFKCPWCIAFVTSGCYLEPKEKLISLYQITYINSIKVNHPGYILYFFGYKTDFFPSKTIPKI